MRILGIETSCDDTGIAIIEISGRKQPTFSILVNLVSSQVKIHQKYGGVYPSLAKREHEKNLPIVLRKALRQPAIKKLPWQKIDAIAVTYGPGLSPCLWTGINFAKELARARKIPLVPVDHIEGHLLLGLFEQTKGISNFQPEKSRKEPRVTFTGFPIAPIANGQIQDTKYKIQNTKKIFPAVALIVSGGHTQLVLVKNIGNYQIIGETRDDAAGECFDKTARILGLPYPGGPAIATQAEKFEIRNSKFEIKLPRPMMHTKDYDFSFSGLKTAVLYEYQSHSQKEQRSKEYIQAMAAEIQEAIVDVLIFKTLRAAKEYGAKSIILGGGVAANVELRRVFEARLQTMDVRLLAPPRNLSTDNGAMIAVAGYFQLRQDKAIKNWDKIEALPNLRIA